jgi:hypothetical protein
MEKLKAAFPGLDDWQGAARAFKAWAKAAKNSAYQIP